MDLPTGLAGNVAQLMAQPRLTLHAGKVQFPRRERDFVPLRHSLRPGLPQHFALVQLHSGKVHAERTFHLGPHGFGQIDTVSLVRRRGGNLSRFQHGKADAVGDAVLHRPATCASAGPCVRRRGRPLLLRVSVAHGNLALSIHRSVS